MTLFGAIGYLYAEQEINEICKIYGYGYGSSSDGGGTYTVGGPFDEAVTGKVEETGARSITFDDLSNLTGVSWSVEESGNVDTKQKYYPTIKNSDGTCRYRRKKKSGCMKLKS